MERSDCPAPHPIDPKIDRHLTLRDSALLAAIPALYVGAYALRFWHLLP